MAIVRELSGVLAAGVILGCGILGFMWLGESPEVAKIDVTKELPGVELSLAEQFTETFELETDGIAVPYREISIPAEVDGQVTRQSESARAGRFVTQGEFLLEIDPSDYKLEVDRLQALTDQATEELAAIDVDLVNTQSLIELAKKQVILSRKDQDRMEKLAVRSASSEGQIDQAQTKVLASQNSLQSLVNQLSVSRQRKRSLEAGLRLAQLEGEQAQVDLNRTSINSPITGSIISHLVEVNKYVRKGDELFTLLDASRMEVRCNLELDQVYWVLEQGLTDEEPDLRARFKIPQLPVRVLYDFEGQVFEWEGRLDRYEGTGIDQQTRTVPCRIVVERPDQMTSLTAGLKVQPPALVSGMYVKLQIAIRPNSPLVKVPLAALRPGNEVWKLVNDELKIVPVSVARKEKTYVLIRPSSGLEAGDRVVTSPLASVNEDMKVRELSE